MNSKIVGLAEKFRAFKDKHATMSKELVELNAGWNECETQLLDAMVDEGVKTIKIDGVGMLMMVTTHKGNVVAANKPVFFDYLKESGHDSILKLDVNSMTLSAFLKSHIEELAKKYEAEGNDEVDARNKAVDFLKEKGASLFSEKTIRFRSS